MPSPVLGSAHHGRYGLIVAGASIRWMDWHSVLPAMSTSLSGDGFLAIVSGHEIAAPWVGGNR